MRPAEAAPAKEPWQMKREEYRHFETKAKYDAIVQAIKAGKPIQVATQYRVTPLRSPAHIRLTSTGEVQIPEGRGWVFLTEPQIDSLARQAGMQVPEVGSEERVTHQEIVERALAEGKAVPRAILEEYEGQPWADAALAKLRQAEEGQVPTKEEGPEKPPLAAYGLKAEKTTTARGNPVWEVTGSTAKYRDALKAAGGRAFKRDNAWVWSFYGETDPTEKIVAEIKKKVGAPGEEGTEGTEGAERPGSFTRLDRRVSLAEIERGRYGQLVAIRGGAPAEGIGPDIDPKIGAVLRPHQADGVRLAVAAIDSYGGFILADGTGAGKTMQIVTAADHYARQGNTVLIVVPNRTIINDAYKRDAGMLGVEIAEVKGNTLKEGAVNITTYRSLEKVRRTSPDYILFDESHSLKNPGSDRSINGMAMAERAKGVLFASATPFDKGEHLPYLAKTGIFEQKSHEEIMRDLGYRRKTITIKTKYGNEIQRNIWDPYLSLEERVERMELLFNELADLGLMVKREVSMDNVAVGFWNVDLAEEGHSKMVEIEEYYCERYHVDDPAALPPLAKAQMLMAQRRFQEHYKKEDAYRLAEEEVKNGRQVVLFATRTSPSHLKQRIYMFGELVEEVIVDTSPPTLPDLAERFEAAGIPVARIYGEGNVDAEVKRFQLGEAKVALVTPEKGGAGLSLDDTTGDAPRTMIVMTPLFSGVDNVQVAGRINRMTTKSSGRVVYMLADTSVDAWNRRIITEKMKTLNAVVRGDIKKLDLEEMDADTGAPTAEGRGEEGRHQIADAPDEIARLVMAADDNPHLKNVRYVYRNEELTYKFKREEMERSGYRNLPEGEEGEYIVTGYLEPLPDGTWEIVLGRGATPDTVLEETVHFFQKRLREIDPDLADDIAAWEKTVRARAEKHGIEIPQGYETFAQAYVFAEMGYADEAPEIDGVLLAELVTVPDDILERFGNILGASETGKNDLAIWKGTKFPKTSRGLRRLARDEEAARLVAVGDTDTIYTEDDIPIEIQYALIEIEDLITSHDINLSENPDFPKELQPRHVNIKTSEERVATIVGRLNPVRLGLSVMVGDGAPVIGPDGVVEVGNHRTIALMRVYRQNEAKAEKYRTWLADNATKFGLTREAVEAINKPVLVRVRQTEIDRRLIAEKGNVPTAAQMSPSEIAEIDARKLTGEILEKFVADEYGNINTAANRKFIEAFLQHVVSDTERGKMGNREGTQLTQHGLNRVRNAIFARVYGNTDALIALSDDLDVNIKNIINAMVSVSPQMLKIKDGIEKGAYFPLDISSDIAAAAMKLSNLRDQKMSVDEYFKQIGMFGEELTDIGKFLLDTFDTYKRSARMITDILRRYAHAVFSAGNPQQISFFRSNAPTKIEALKAAVEETLKERADKREAEGQTSLFPEGEKVGGEGTPPAHEPGGERQFQAKRITTSYAPQEVRFMLRTARKGRGVGAKSVVAEWVRDNVPKGADILDFGSGYGEQMEMLREAGFKTVEGHDLRTPNPKALRRQHDVTYASKVLNVQPTISTLERTLEHIKQTVKVGGYAVMNYPSEPRYPGRERKSGVPLKPAEVARMIEETFEWAPRVVGGRPGIPIFKVTRPWEPARQMDRLGRPLYHKDTADAQYFHPSAMALQPKEIQDRVAAAKKYIPEDFGDYQVIKVSRKDEGVSFIKSPDFDTAPEPQVGDSVRVVGDQVTFRTAPTENYQIYHHKWQMVADDYAGFDVQEAMERSRQWETRALEQGVKIDRNRIGYINAWNELMEKLGAGAEISFQIKRLDTFYYKAEKAAEKMQRNIPAGQVVPFLKKQGVRDSELRSLGLEVFLEGKETVTRREVQDFIQRNKLYIEEFYRIEGAGIDLKIKWDVARSNYEIAKSAFQERLKKDIAANADWYIQNIKALKDVPEQYLYDTVLRKLERHIYHNYVDRGDIGIHELPRSVRGYAWNYANIVVDMRLAREAYRQAPEIPKFARYTLANIPGHEYTELAIKFPEPVMINQMNKERVIEYLQAKGAPQEHLAVVEDRWEEESKIGMLLEQHYPELAKELPRWSLYITHPYEGAMDVHQQPINTLGHIRFKTVYDEDGQRVMFVEEIQSDWAAEYQKHRPLSAKEIEELVRLSKMPEEKLTAQDRRRYEKLRTRHFQNMKAEMPWYNDWHEFLLKRVIRLAADNGYDYVSWTTGDQQRERYNLARYVDKLIWDKTNGVLYAYKKNGVQLEGIRCENYQTLEANIGKELADKMEKSAPVKAGYDSADRIVVDDSVLIPPSRPDLRTEEQIYTADYRVLKGEGLAVGGIGLKKIYDELIPTYLNKYLKQYGVQVEDRVLHAVDTEWWWYGPNYSAEALRGYLPPNRPLSGNEFVALKKVIHGMEHEGMSFAQAMESYGPLSSVLPKILGGELKRMPVEYHQPAIRITPEMGADYPLFQIKRRRKAKLSLEEVERRLDEKVENNKGSVAFGMSVRETTGPHVEDETTHRFRPDIQEQWEKYHGLPKENYWQGIKEGLVYLGHLMERSHVHLPNEGWAMPLRSELIFLSKYKSVAADKAVRRLKALLHNILRNADDFDIYEKMVLLEDLREDYTIYLETKAKDTEGKMGEYKWKLGFDEASFAEEYAVLKREVAERPAVQLALKERRLFWDSLVERYIKSQEAIGHHVEEKFKRQSYYRHQVMKYAELVGVVGAGHRLRTARGRSYLKGRIIEGSEEGINTNYLEAEFEVIAQMYFDIRLAEVIASVDRNYNIIDRLKAEAVFMNDKNIMPFMEKLAEAMNEGRAGHLPPLTAENAYSQFLNMKIAIGFDRLGELAYKGMLPDTSDQRYGELIASLGETWYENKQIRKEAGEDFDPGMLIPLSDKHMQILFKYCNWLLKAHGGGPGSGVAATIFKGIAEKKEKMKAILKEQYVTWEDLIPEGYATWAPTPGNVFYMADSIPANLAARVFEGVLEEVGVKKEDIRKVLARGAKFPQFVVREEVALTLEDLSRGQKQPSPARELIRRTVRAWKQWQLVSPVRYTKYNLRNLSSDIELPLALNLGTFKYVPRAYTELYRMLFGDGKISKDLEAWAERGGLQSTLQAQEMGDINQLKEFDALLKRHGGDIKKIPREAWHKYWRTARLTTDLRESILRYASYLDFLKQMREDKEGRPKTFAASIPGEIMALEKLEDRAYWLSNELMGAYDRVSQGGQWLREHLIPFWSWKEINMKRFIRIMRNASENEQLCETVGRWAINRMRAKAGQKLVTGKLLEGKQRGAGRVVAKSALVVTRIGQFLIRAAALWIIFQIYNRLRYPEEEEGLPERVQNQWHIIVGRDKKGNVIYFDRLGHMGDLLEWLGDMPWNYVNDMIKGRKTALDVAGEMGKGAVNVIMTSLMPYISLPAEFVTRQKLFPDAFDPTQIKDFGYHVAQGLGLDPVYNLMLGKPHRSFGEVLQRMIAYKQFEGQGAYYDIRREVREYLRAQGVAQGAWISEPNARNQALMYLRLALVYEDAAALEKYMREYLNAGGTIDGIRTSLRNMDPLYGLKAQRKKDFAENWLDEEGRRRLLMAERYYNEVVLANEDGEKGMEEIVKLLVKMKEKIRQ